MAVLKYNYNKFIFICANNNKKGENMKKLIKKVGLTLNSMMGFTPKSPNGRYPTSNAKDYIADGYATLNSVRSDYQASNDEFLNKQEINQAYTSTLAKSAMWLIICVFFALRTNFDGGWEHATFGTIVIAATLLYSAISLYHAFVYRAKLKGEGGHV